jgi:16S rRNA processing protein RimM
MRFRVGTFYLAPMQISDCFKIGYIARSHGLKGEVTIVRSPECPALEDLKSVFVERGNQLVPHFIQHVSVRGVKAFIKFEDVDSPEGAESLKGSSLFLPKKERPKLAKGEFYSDEVVGFQVFDKAHGVLGVVNDVLESGPGRYLSIPFNSKEIMIPLNGPFIKGVNKTKKTISVELPDGYLDI